MKHKLDCAYHTSTFEKHQDLKYEILKLIEQTPYDSPKELQAEVNITKTDWNHSKNMDRKWVRYLFQDLMDHMLVGYKELGYGNFTVTDLWFQQYEENSEHGWHIHGENFTNVYYLELPNETPKTQLISPYDQKTIIELDVKEGDTVIFPSFVLHKAPKNKSNQRKSIVSFNSEVGYPDEIYRRNLDATI
jgi:hypothetical protein